MPTAAWRPDWFVGVAFNANPNDPNAVPTWTDLTSLFRQASGVKRGRQYELDQNQGSQPSMVFYDRDEYLNPGNVASPYAPNVVPYRQLLWQGMWPNGGTGNLLNIGAQGTSYDPSFESYTTGAAVPWLTAVGGASPLVSTTTPHSGSRDVTWTVVNGATVQGVSWTLPTMPGRQYTTSAYVRQSSASTQQIAITGVAAGTSTTTTGAYVRLTVTWTATQPSHTVTVQTSGTAVAGTVLLDDVQHEPGASASTFTTTGPVIYGILRDYAERWPSRWDYQGFVGYAECTLVDAFAPQNKIRLSTEYANALLATAPRSYWRLNDGSAATVFAETSGNNDAPLTLFTSKYGSGTAPTPGTTTAIAGDPSGTGVLFVEDKTTPPFPSPLDVTAKGTILSAGQPGTTGIANLPPTPSAPWAVSVSLWLLVTDQNPLYDYQIVCAAFDYSLVLGPSSLYYANVPVQLTVKPDGTLELKSQIATAGTEGAYFATSTSSVANKTWHHIVGTISQNNTNTVLSLYIDGALAATSTTSTSTTGLLNKSVNSFQVGARFGTGAGYVFTLGGTVAHVALWNRVVSSSEVTTLWNAGKGFPGETSGARVARYLSYGWSGLTAIDTGQSTMGVSDLSDGTALLAAVQNVATSENGNYWVDPRGYSTFAARTRRYLETSSVYTFGDRPDLGELPYLEDLSYDLDPTLIYNDVQVTNSGGVVARATSAASKLAFFTNSYQRSINVQNNYEAFDAANYILNQHDLPRQRVSVLTLDPVGTPNLWPVVLSLEVGMRVTVKRRPKAGNAGVGFTMSADFFVESISHDNVDIDSGTWLTQLLLSPVDIAQVGILDNSTFGRLGISSASLASGITASATSASVTCPGGDLFTTTGTPFQATIDAEIVTVTAVTGAASPQTLTITRPTDGTAVAHSTGAAVQVYQPFVLAY